MDGESEAVAEAPVEVAPLPTVEELAAKLGWKPEDQWEGPKEKYRGPVEYIEAGQHGKLVKQVKQLQETTERMARTAAQTTARMLSEQEAELTAKLKKAVDEDDAVAAVTLDRELRQVVAERQQPDDAVSVFTARNPWFNVDPDATDFAAAISERLAKQGKSVADQLEAAETGVRKRFPELFDEPAPRRQAPIVAAPSSRTSAPSKREKSAADLPSDARSAGMEFVAMAEAKGRKYTIDDYAKTYWADHA